MNRSFRNCANLHNGSCSHMCRDTRFHVIWRVGLSGSCDSIPARIEIEDMTLDELKYFKTFISCISRETYKVEKIKSIYRSCSRDCPFFVESQLPF